MIRLLGLLKSYRGYLAIVLVMAFLQSAANLYLPTLMADIVDNGIVKSNVGYIVAEGVLMVLVTLGGAACAVVGSFYSSRVAVDFGRIVRGRIFKHMAQSLHQARPTASAEVSPPSPSSSKRVILIGLGALLVVHLDEATGAAVS
jgi:ATP-binding cassette subfamily B multidrug efflux pump